MTREEKAKEFGRIISERIIKIHEVSPRGMPKPRKNRRWDAVAGQWLVYGLERQLGFGRGVELCSVVERAWRANESVSEAAEKLYLVWFNET